MPARPPSVIPRAAAIERWPNRRCVTQINAMIISGLKNLPDNHGVSGSSQSYSHSIVAGGLPLMS